MTSSQHAHRLCVDSGLRLSPRLAGPVLGPRLAGPCDYINVRRECILRSLVVYVNEDPDVFFKEYLPTAVEDAERDITTTVMGIYRIRRDGHEEPEDVGVVIEGIKVLNNLASVTTGFIMLLSSAANATAASTPLPSLPAYLIKISLTNFPDRRQGTRSRGRPDRRQGMRHWNLPRGRNWNLLQLSRDRRLLQLSRNRRDAGRVQGPAGCRPWYWAAEPPRRWAVVRTRSWAAERHDAAESHAYF
ncbi:hypothetical protein N1851_019271 [Merluccius polli]|uniref:Uncharacterized protein n=1 Tax=Merluccius polli TaxID=89951 RepID=A0AA47MLX9_MERPO|nr:hypothetical protein N1851_019271 [Merluccius polli]